jgi:hypothetical protein
MSDEGKLSATLREIADERNWTPDEFVLALLDAIDVIADELSKETSHKLIDALEDCVPCPPGRLRAAGPPHYTRYTK